MSTATALKTGNATRLASTCGQSGSDPNQLATDASIEGLASSALGRELLAALVGFIHPIIRAYTPATNLSGKHDNDHSQSGEQGMELLHALRSFVESTISTEETLSKHQKECDDSKFPIAENSPNALVTLPLRLSDIFMEHEILNTIRYHVFNKMPIRLLAFDSSGSEIRLLDRNETVNLIFHSVCAWVTTPKFNDKYRNLRNYSDKQLLIDDLVQRHSGYAILSHTWIRDTPADVVFTDWNSRTKNPRGYAKITNFCQVAARKHGVTLGWMDTVCINKESSSELDESIRSMYKWYQGADVCVAYMSETETLESMHKDSWFCRGWTLQELLAPTNIQFYDRDWNAIQDSEASYLTVEDRIQQATTITCMEIASCRGGEADHIPISRKFQLAAKRIVTREEDQAYSLMGLLGVDISVAYGEGAERALFRLQREILATKGTPLDMFNCTPGYFNNLLPSSLSQYSRRTNIFDYSNNQVGTTLDLCIPAKPLVCTHLGVGLQVILIPGIAEDLTRLDRHGHWPAKGNFHGRHRCPAYATFRSSTSYLLLHSDIYEKVLPSDTASFYPNIIHFGVINFSIKNDFITFPDTCLAVPLDCGTKRAGSVTQSDIIRMCGINVPVTFKIESRDKTLVTSIHNLESNGMQLVALYL